MHQLVADLTLEQLQDKSYDCQVINIKDIKPVGDLPKEITRCDCLLVLHALHAEYILRYVTCPVILIFGGTDVYQHANNAASHQRMSKVVARASALVCFTNDISVRVRALWGDDPVLRVIPQSVSACLPPSAGSDSPSSDPLTKCIITHLPENVTPNPILFLLPAGLRPVKDVLHAASAFSAWSAEASCKHEKSVCLVIIGAVLDESYAEHVRETLSGLHQVYLVPPASRHTLLQLMQDECVRGVCNTSLSEGQSATILESMSAGTPVIVRDNPGNRSLVRHRETGLVYSTPQDFVSCCEMLISSSSVAEVGRMREAARSYVETHHSSSVEAQQYNDLITEVLLLPPANNDGKQ